MRELRKRLEMLQEACQQLDKGTATGARLALILLDNLVEIMMYEKVRYIFARDSRFERIIPRKYPDPLRKKVFWGFVEKVDLLVRDTDAISEDQGKVLKAGHRLRNEAYHRGEVREGIIGNVSRTYLRVVCDILPRLWNGMLMLVPGESVAEYLKQFGVDANMIDEDVLRQVCASFLYKRSCSLEELTNALSADLVRRIEEVVYGCEYLGDGGYERVSAEDILKNLQFNPQFHEKHEFAQTDEGFREFIEIREREFAEYVPPITLATLHEWKRRAEAICSMAAPGNALEEYWNIDRMLSDIQEMVSQAVYEFDEWINMQVHDRGL